MSSTTIPTPLETKAFVADDERLPDAIDNLIRRIRASEESAEEVISLKTLLLQLRTANENLVLATVKAQALQEQADERNRLQNEFLAMLAHELRNPMAPISNAAKLLERIAVAHPLLPQLEGIITRQVNHMARLLDDLLDASRITNGRVTLQLATTSLNDVLKHAIEVSRPYIDKRKQQFLIAPARESIVLECDAVRLSQVFSNLLINASKFTPEKGRIELRTEREGDMVRVSVADNGCGIAPEIQSRIFDLFTQGPRQSDSAEGSGLGIGLSVAKAIVEMHGGRISVKSSGPGLGSCFEVMLPASGVKKQKPVDAAPVVKPFSANCRNILLIEDDADTNATLEMLLALEGHRITSARDGLVGLSMAKIQRYDIIICDIELPGMGGLEVIKHIRNQVGSKAFAIALSGYCQAEDRARAIDAGFDQYIVKPIKGDHLIHMIETQAAAAIHN